MSTPEFSRRTFLKTTAAAATLSQLPLAGEPAPATQPWPENGILIPDDGWHLWVDRKADWKNDTLYLPDNVDLLKLPTNEPTGGWEMLGKQPDAIPVTLPSTVEQHFWGKFGQRPYTAEEYRYAADDPIPQNGAFFGVSWWSRDLDIPAAMRGKRIFLHIRGAHLRAEVYLNRKLVGYSIMEELPFECDLTAAARFSEDGGGANQLAIRITNPFGRFDWVDGLNAQWGAVKLYRSHGFGGLDRGMTISANDPTARIGNVWIFNSLRSTDVVAHADYFIPFSQRNKIRVLQEVIEPATGRVVAKSPDRTDGEFLRSPGAPANEAVLLHNETPLSYRDARPWGLETPVLYHLRTTLRRGDEVLDSRTIPFGFRTFTTENVTPAPTELETTNHQTKDSQKPALFRLNGKRTRIYTSISWGYWGYNGMFPTPELAEKEVTQAKRLNLNCLNFHRNLAKEDVLRAHDRLGLLRYMEPGAGKLAIGKLPSGVAANSANIVMEKPTDPADLFAQRYMFERCVRMVRAYRSHPSVIEYCLQNEIGADLNNPDTLAILAAMRAEDPSRCIVLNDGFVAPPRKAAQAWYEPWNEHLHRSDRQPWGGWWNQHQGAGDQWYDEFYKSPTDFTYAAPNYPGVLTEYGEMEGCATPDNHSLMLQQQGATPSYDKRDHEEILAATDKFLDKWGFRKAFPATESLWLSIGRKCYDTWQNYLENARISDDLDYAAISGWESTSIENHSGIVDNLRNFKSDPTPIAATLQPIRPVAKQRSMCTALGRSATFDLYLLNDTSMPVTGTLEFTAVTPSGKLLKLASNQVPKQSPDVFSYLLQADFQTPPLTEEGRYRFKFALSSSATSTQTKEIWVTSTSLKELAGTHRIGVSGISPGLRKQLDRIDFITVEDFVPSRKYDAIISSGLTSKTTGTQNSGDTTGLEAQPAAVPGRKLEPGEAVESTQTGHLQHGILEAVQAGTPLLCIPQTDALSEGCAQQLAAAGAFTYHGTVGDFRAPWMGNWYFVREHVLYAGMPVNQAMGIHYQAKGRQSNGLLVDGPNVEVIVGYSRDHDRTLGAGTFTTRLGNTKVIYHRVPELHPVLQQRFLANALRFLTA